MNKNPEKIEKHVDKTAEFNILDIQSVTLDQDRIQVELGYDDLNSVINEFEDKLSIQLFEAFTQSRKYALRNAQLDILWNKFNLNDSDANLLSKERVKMFL